MAWDAALSADADLSITTEKVFQRSSADWKIGLTPGELAACEVKGDFPGSPTDDLIVTVYGSTADSPGAVPDDGTAVAGSDWSVILQFTIDNADDTVWKPFNITGWPWFAVTGKRSGSTDTITGNLRVRLDAVDI